YDVRFKLGDFASRRFITFERYEMVREAGAEVATGEEAAFTVEPFEGDLFAEAGLSPREDTHELSMPSPNPADGATAFVLQVSEAQRVTVTVHDALGREVARLHDGSLAAGTPHRLVFDGSSFPAGVYAVRAVGEAFSDTRVVTLAR
ncbi:MAG: hypothetical protein R3181_01595, partial [Rubricoccaceae bacterium]|nr:hypothetical protein [Rubricoccaceae bacterium]